MFVFAQVSSTKISRAAETVHRRSLHCLRDGDIGAILFAGAQVFATRSWSVKSAPI
jgi:hypothetical protein